MHDLRMDPLTSLFHIRWLVFQTGKTLEFQPLTEFEFESAIGNRFLNFHKVDFQEKKGVAFNQVAI